MNVLLKEGYCHKIENHYSFSTNFFMLELSMTQNFIFEVGKGGGGGVGVRFLRHCFSLVSFSVFLCILINFFY